MPNTASQRVAHSEFVNQFMNAGYAFPVEVMTRQQARSYLRQLNSLERLLGGVQVGNKNQLNYPHVLFRFANEIVRNTQILDLVEAIIGPDILVWGSTFFIKDAKTENYVSWHQDLRYWGLSDEDGQVSVWVALSPATKANGCMRFLPRSHNGELLAHHDTHADNNILTRGQEASVEIYEDNVVHAELKPGQASFHHGKLLHASAANRSNVRRIGLAINYIGAHVRQTVARKDYGMLVRGTDRFGYFEPVPAPSADCTETALAWHQRILAAQNDVLYDGSAIR